MPQGRAALNDGDGKPSGSGRRRRAGATIADVARHAGVSAMTVSRVMNREAGVREQTRLRVTEAVAALGYAPDPAARSLAGGRTVRVGLLHSNPSAGYLAEFLLGALDACSRFGFPLLVEKCDPDEDPSQAVDRLVRAGADGVLAPAPLCESPVVLKRLEELELPAVAVAGEGGSRLASIRIDDLAAARATTEHLLALGHRRIGFVTGDPNQSASELRRRGFLEAVAAANADGDPELTVPGDFTYRSGLDAGEQLLGLRRRPTAIFASNDDMAAGVLAAAHRRGLDVPKALSVCGFDDTPLATSVWPELTTIRQPVAEMARTATEILADAVRRARAGRPPSSSRHVAAFDLRVRGSTGAAPGQSASSAMRA